MLDEARLGGGTARRLFGYLAYRGGALGKELAGCGVLLATERAERRREERQQVEVAFASLEHEFRLGETLIKTLVGLATRIAAKVTAYTFAFLIDRRLGRPQGRIKELWARHPRNTHLASWWPRQNPRDLESRFRYSSSPRQTRPEALGW